ncbi:PepSY domain-containing protein [Brachybacterium sacelli]|uniref:Membrane protein YkoI n=1 Tax=Brachybacterium sacelli TaxID=173364 RepID=A0ABS4X4M9_9MICO|nr:PepSY domain-containing protein [Brachybacterium sacelli]MBP2383422.1 putative membrane protein YkoI [Brachybacterium sacelli]
MTRTARSRSTVRAAALGAFVIALAAGCGGQGDENGEGITQGEGSGGSASDGGGSDGASDGGASGGASDGGGSDEASDGGGSDDAASGSGQASALPADADLASEQLPVPAEEAVGIAVQTAGGGETESVSIDHDDDRGWTWEIEVAVDGSEHNLDIDATTGKVLEHEEDDDRVEDPVVDVTSPMTPQEAIDLAVAERDSRVSGWDLDSDDGAIRYQVDIQSSGDDDVEVGVDVESGEVRVED